MELLFIPVLLVAFATAIFYWFKRIDDLNTKEFAKRNLKFVKLGNLFASVLKKERMEMIKSEIISKEGPIFGFTMLNKFTVMIAEPELIQTVLHKDFTNFTNRREFPIFNKVLNENVVFSPDEQWKRLRSIITPAFSVGKLKRMKPSFDETIQNLLKNIDRKLKTSQIHDVKQIFDAFAIDALIQVAFGVKVDSLNQPKNPIIQYSRMVFQNYISFSDLIRFTTIFFFPKLAQLLNLEVHRKATDFFTKLSIDIINEKKAEFARTKNYSKASSFIEFMLEAEEEGRRLLEENDENCDEVKKPTKFMTNDEIVANSCVFLLGGAETTSSGITSAAFQLALNPGKQEKLYQEIVSVLQKLKLEFPNESDIYKLISYDNLAKFEYLNAVMNETLRIDSPGTFIERLVSKDTEFSRPDGSGHFSVKKNDIIHIPTFSLHRDAKYFPEPDVFKPERFIGEQQFPKYAYLPFGSGPRNCVAKNMALLETKLALLHVVLNFKFEICSETKIPMEFYNQFDLITPKEAKLRIVKRN